MGCEWTMLGWSRSMSKVIAFPCDIAWIRGMQSGLEGPERIVWGYGNDGWVLEPGNCCKVIQTLTCRQAGQKWTK